MLAEHPGRVFTKTQIYERVWGEDAFGDLGTVNVHVRCLRRATGYRRAPTRRY